MKKDNLRKIIIFYPSFERGGVEIILQNLINFFLRKKIKVVLISSNIKKNFFKNKLFEYQNIQIRNFPFLPDRINKAVSASKTLSNELKVSSKKDTLVLSLQGSSLAIIFTKLLRFKIIVRNAEDPIYSAFYADNKIQSLIILLLKMVLYNFADKIVTNSKGSKDSIKKILIKKNNIYPIYNPYLKSVNRKLNKKRNKFLLSVGRLAKQKDFYNLIIAFDIIKHKIPNYKLIIVGDGQLKSKLKKLVFDRKLEKRIKFTGWEKNLKKYYSNSKLFILNSVYEGLGNVLIDAVNYNLPIITTNCKSGPNEIISYGKGGFLVPIKSPTQLSKKILFCINNYRYSLQKAKYAKKKIKRFDCDYNCEKYLKLIIETIND